MTKLPRRGQRVRRIATGGLGTVISYDDADHGAITAAEPTVTVAWDDDGTQPEARISREQIDLIRDKKLESLIDWVKTRNPNLIPEKAAVSDPYLYRALNRLNDGAGGYAPLLYRVLSVVENDKDGGAMSKICNQRAEIAHEDGDMFVVYYN